MAPVSLDTTSENHGTVESPRSGIDFCSHGKGRGAALITFRVPGSGILRGLTSLPPELLFRAHQQIRSSSFLASFFFHVSDQNEELQTIHSFDSYGSWDLVFQEKQDLVVRRLEF